MQFNGRAPARLAIFVVALAILAPAAALADWPLFRGGPQQLGVASGRLSTRPTLTWRYGTGGPVVSSPVVANGRVYVGSHDRYVYCFNQQTGAKIWSFGTGDAIEAPPAVIGDTVVIGSADRYLYALDAARGTLKWKYETDAKILGGANPVPAPGGATWVLVGSYDNYLHCVNLATGKRVWAFETENYVNGAPAVSGGNTIFGGCDGSLYVVRIADGKLVREVPINNYIAASAAVDGQTAFLGHYGKRVQAVDIGGPRPTGGGTNWIYRDRNFEYFSSPAVTRDRVVIGGRDRQVHCIDRAAGTKVWSFRTRGVVDSSPVICDAKVVVGSEDGRIYMLGLERGNEIWSYEIGAPITSSPAVSDGMIFIGAQDGNVYAFNAAP